MSIAAGAIIAKQKHIIRAFEQANAVDDAHAVAPESINTRQSLVFRKLVARGVLVSAGGGKFYLNLGAYAAHRKRRQKLVAIFLAAVAIGAAVAVVFKVI